MRDMAVGHCVEKSQEIPVEITCEHRWMWMRQGGVCGLWIIKRVLLGLGLVLLMSSMQYLIHTKIHSKGLMFVVLYNSFRMNSPRMFPQGDDT